jgi:hypothetical protein
MTQTTKNSKIKQMAQPSICPKLYGDSYKRNVSANVIMASSAVDELVEC